MSKEIEFAVPENTFFPEKPKDGLMEFVLPDLVICRVDDTFTTQSALDAREWLAQRLDDFTTMQEFVLATNEPLPSTEGTVRAGVGSYVDAQGKPRWAASIIKRFPAGETVAFTAQWPNLDGAEKPDLALLERLGEMAHLKEEGE